MKDDGRERTGRLLSGDEIGSILDRAVNQWDLDGKRVLVLVPDHTRTCPLDTVFPMLYERIAGRVTGMTVMVALGTHPSLPQERILSLLGVAGSEARYSKAKFVNHQWQSPDELVAVGELAACEISELTDGRFEMDVTISCNKMVCEHDIIIILGPVFPHEVAGFSGGNKYIVPGISGPEIIDFFHWLGAVITNPVINGVKWTAVRKVIDRSAAMVPAERKAICMVVHHDVDGCTGLAGLHCGSPEDAWSAAADLSARTHIEYRDKQYQTVLACAPEMYDDLWTGGKCMYKVEPVVADGGKVIIYAPHIRELSLVHGRILEEIGYHTRDFFVAQWDHYKRHPWGVIAHSTHVKGIGKYEDGVEKPRIDVVLATGIPREICEKVNLGYADPDSIIAGDFAGREDEGILYVARAGEALYRVRE